MAILSILTLYKWDNTIFEELTVPDGIEKDVLVGNLLAECADFELIYPNPDIMKNMISLWSAKENPIWEKLRATQLFEYNPIENYNRVESWETETENTGFREARTTDKETGSESQTREGESSQKKSGSVGRVGTESQTREGETTQEKSGSVGRVGGGSENRQTTNEETEENNGSRNNTGTGNNANAITTFDLNTEQPLSSTTTTGTSQENTQGSRSLDGSGSETVTRTENYTDTTEDNSSENINETLSRNENYTDTITDTETGTSSDTLTGTRQNEKTITGVEDNTATGTEKRTGKTSGNIGVTTTQQMIEQEREVVKFSLYDYIISSFRARFCILLY